MSCVGERGAGRWKAVFWLLVLVALVYCTVKILPHYINNYQLEDAMKTEARFGSVQRTSDEEIRNVVYRKIQELEIPAHREDIRVQSAPGGVRIELSYTVEVDLAGYRLKLQFHPSADNRSL